jgi:hypothetical protein
MLHKPGRTFSTSGNGSLAAAAPRARWACGGEVVWLCPEPDGDGTRTSVEPAGGVSLLHQVEQPLTLEPCPSSTRCLNERAAVIERTIAAAGAPA